MTAQAADTISIEGDTHALCVLPLEPLFDAMANPPLFEPPTSANSRGYIASWKIDDKRLWLVRLHGRLENKPGRVRTQRRTAKHPKDYHQNIISRIETLPQDRFGIRHADEHWFGYLIHDDNGVVDLNTASRITAWPAAGSADTELGVMMEPEVCHGEAEVYTRIQA